MARLEARPSTTRTHPTYRSPTALQRSPEQDQHDVERLLTLHGERVRLERVRQIVGELAAAIDESDRVADLERVIARVGLDSELAGCTLGLAFFGRQQV